MLRRTALRRGTKPLRAGRKLRPVTDERRESRATFRQAVLVRDFLCVRCGKSQAVDAHHVTPTGRGGSDDPASGVGLCRACHDYITHTVEGIREAKARGLLA